MPSPIHSVLLAALLSAVAVRALAADAPVSVSALNYANSTREELIRLDVEKNQVNPSAHPLKAAATPQRYVFIPGELNPSDISYDEICRRLSVALANKGYLNATDELGRVHEPTKVDLILRVHSGERPWRIPTARIDQLTWREGLAARPRFRTLTTLGGEVAWESRAGGNDAALDAAAANENAPSFGFGSSAGSGAPATSVFSAGAAATEYEITREFYLIVVDAFSYQELREKGEYAHRLWTTFVAAPRQPGQKFSDVLNTMLRVATPYFGETARGLQVFNDARARVDLGPLQVLESDVSIAPKK